MYFLLQGKGQPADGIADPEEVSIASAEASITQYVGLLTVTVAAGFFFASKAFKDGEVHWLPLLGTLVAGYLTYEGAFYLSLQNYVNTVQRPKSRVRRDTTAAWACRFLGAPASLPVSKAMPLALLHCHRRCCCCCCAGKGEGVLHTVFEISENVRAHVSCWARGPINGSKAGSKDSVQGQAGTQ